MPNSRNYHIMISHSFFYDNYYQTIKEWLDNALDWTDYSVPISRPDTEDGVDELKQNISASISTCNCIIILSGMYAAYSDWIDFVIETAMENKKPIIGVMPWGREHVPSIIQYNAETMVLWNSDAIVDAVRRYSV